MQTTWGTLASKLTTVDTYVDADPTALATYFASTVQFGFTATTNDLKVKVLGSLDGGTTEPHTAIAEFTVSAATTVLKTLTTFYTHLKVQVKPAGAGSHGTLTSQYALKS
tara:strand:+ start:56 stop:385 length:330 start_codon:yes stop_codon:yes gene_type:complete